MRLLKFVGVQTLAGAVALTVVLAPTVFGRFGSPALAEGRPFDSTQGTQDEPRDRARRVQDFMVLAGRGAEIGVQIAEGKDAGVVIEGVRPDGPAEKAGLKKSDVIVEFCG